MAKAAAVFLGALLISGAAWAAPDYSGVYDCTGNDAHEGAYRGIVTMHKDVAHSTEEFGTYSFTLEVPDFGTYSGMAVSQDDKLAVYFSLPGQANGDYGVGIATVQPGADGRLGFRKFYYEPQYKGGNTGAEDCVRR